MSNDDISAEDLLILRTVAMANAVGWRAGAAAIADLAPLTIIFIRRLQRQGRNYAMKDTDEPASESKEVPC